MNYLNVKKFGFAVGATGALLYISCVLSMFFVGHNGAALFFNSLLHGLDVCGIVPANLPIAQAFIGIGETFVLGWLIGACVAAVYNAALQVPMPQFPSNSDARKP